MSTLSGRTPPLSGESSFDARLCAELGAQLAREREARGLTTTEVGERLLLSVRQVKALETVDISAFHNPTFHLKALRKYATLAAIEPSLIARLSSAIAAQDSAPAALAPARSRVDLEPPSRRLAPMMVGVIVVSAAFAAGLYVLRVRPAPIAAASLMGITASSPAVVDAVTPTPPSAQAEPAAAPPAEELRVVTPGAEALATPLSSPAVFGTLHVIRSTWIFLRDSDGGVVERTMADEETLALESQPTYLAIGTADAELLIGTRRIDLSRFLANGQVRIRAGDFDALVQGATPIPAPTPAARP
jgi:cytoskeleton protein RodZ